MPPGEKTAVAVSKKLREAGITIFHKKLWKSGRKCYIIVPDIFVSDGNAA